MEDAVTLEDIVRDPGLIAKSARLPSGEEVMLRPLDPGDAKILGEYFLGLSERTTSLYAPHPFDQATADHLCKAVNNADTLRMLATAHGCGTERVIAYFIVMWRVNEGERARYEEAGIELDSATDCTIAPSVADEYQNQGLGSVMMEHLIDAARRLGRERMVLSGGTREENKRAIHFYEKFGFRKVNEFREAGVNNQDMIMGIR